MHCIIDELNISGVPLLTVYQPNNSKIAFIFHKLLENKMCELPMAYRLAKEGYFVIIVDVHGHGERINGFDKVGSYDFSMIYRDAYETASEINTVLDQLKQKYKTIDDTSVTCIGASNGANIAFIAGHLVRNVTHVVSLIGSLSWDFTINRNTFKKFAQKSQVFDYEKMKGDIERYNPIDKFENLGHLPYVLFQNSVLDTTMQIKSAEESYLRLLSIYSQRNKGDAINLQKYYKTGHYVSKVMMDNLITWLRECTEG